MSRGHVLVPPNREQRRAGIPPVAEVPATVQIVNLVNVNLVAEIESEGQTHVLVIGALGGQKILGVCDVLRIPMDALFAANFRKRWEELADRVQAQQNGHQQTITDEELATADEIEEALRANDQVDDDDEDDEHEGEGIA